MGETYSRWRAKDPDGSRAVVDRARNAWMARNPDWVAEQYVKHREKKIAASQRWAENNRHAARAIKRRWKRSNPEWVNGWVAKRAKQVGRATPPWLTPEQHEQIAAIYREARSRGPGWHVDHIVPLHGRHVSGLHVPWNLQILPAAENLAKGNRLLDVA